MRSIARTLPFFVVLTCGGTVSSAPCEGTVTPFAAPLSPTFQVAYGTAIVSASCAPNVFPAECSTGWTAIDILLTPTPNACPSRWLSSSLTTDTEVRAVWLGIQFLTDTDPSGTYQATSDPWDWSFFNGANGPFIVSLMLPKGAVPGNPGYPPPNGASGSISITHYVAGQVIAGTFDAQFTDGTHLSESFNIPFCTSACYSP